MHPAVRSALLVSFALGLYACATAGDGDDGDDSGALIPTTDAAADAESQSDAAIHGYDSSTMTGEDASSASDTSPGVDAFPPPADASTHADASSSPDASAADTGTQDTGPTGPCSFSGAIATFDLSSQAGDESSVAVTSTASGVTAGALSRASGLTAVSGSGSINSSGWPTASSADSGKYYTFTVTPPTGCSLSLTTLAIDVKASGTGPSTGDVATSSDSFAAHTTSFAGTSTTSVTLSGATGTSPIEIRVYGYGASGTAGTFRILSTLTLSGSLE